MRMVRVVLSIFALVFLASAPIGSRERSQSAGYDDLVALFKEWRAFQTPRQIDGVPDFSPKTMTEQRRELAVYQRRLTAIDPSRWPIPQQVDYHLVRAEMNGLEFDHRVLHPWARNPLFYTVVHDSQTDVPLREGPARPVAIELWSYSFPVAAERASELRSGLRAVPGWLAQGKRNLVEDAKDLWFRGAAGKRQESKALAALAKSVAEHHPDLLPDVEKAKAAVDEFGAWLDERRKTMTKASGVGIENYNWYVKNVHLVPYTWQDQLAIVERELGRAWAHLKLLENRNRELPKLSMIATEDEYRRRYREAVKDFITFLGEEELFSVPDYAQPALEAREGGFIPPDRLRDFFIQVEYRDLHPMRAHGTHWFDLARMEREPHPSAIRRAPLLHNIWDTRAEGYATGFEEMVMTAGYLDDKPRVRELVYIMLAQRGARAMGALKMHSNEWTLDQAAKFAVDRTPYGWLPIEGSTVWGEQELYLEQPGYGTSYLIGKVHIEKLLADRAHQLGEKFRLRQFTDDFHAAGMIPVSLIRWEMTGRDDEIRGLTLRP